MSCVKKENKDITYYINNELDPIGYHNPDGPAVIMKDCSTWWLYGLRHRIDGPAIEFKIKTHLNKWFYYGKKVDCNNQEEFDKILNLKAFW